MDNFHRNPDPLHGAQFRFETLMMSIRANIVGGSPCDEQPLSTYWKPSVLNVDIEHLS